MKDKSQKRKNGIPSTSSRTRNQDKEDVTPSTSSRIKIQDKDTIDNVKAEIQGAEGISNVKDEGVKFEVELDDENF
jgi:hypothetical protein